MQKTFAEEGIRFANRSLPLRTLAPNAFACLKVVQIGAEKTCATAADHSMTTLMP